ncbi:hypothetical protein RJZ57_000366 [Blastomyces gilchristii]
MPVRVLLIQERITFEAADKQRNDALSKHFGDGNSSSQSPQSAGVNDAGMKVKISPIDQDLHKIGEDRNYACGFSWQFSFLALLAGSSSQQPDWTQWTEGEIKPPEDSRQSRHPMVLLWGQHVKASQPQQSSAS